MLGGKAYERMVCGLGVSHLCWEEKLVKGGKRIGRPAGPSAFCEYLPAFDLGI